MKILQQPAHISFLIFPSAHKRQKQSIDEPIIIFYYCYYYYICHPTIDEPIAFIDFNKSHPRSSLTTTYIYIFRDARTFCPGPLPETLGNLHGLRKLSLGRNLLSGG